MKSFLRFAAVSALSLGLVVGIPTADAATKKDKKKAKCCECCKDGKCTDAAKKDGKCSKCGADETKA